MYTTAIRKDTVVPIPQILLQYPRIGVDECNSAFADLGKISQVFAMTVIIVSSTTVELRVRRSGSTHSQ